MANDEKLSATIAFRAPNKLLAAVEEHRRVRRLPRISDAARELMECAAAESDLLNAASETRALGLDPLAILRARVAQLPLSS